MRKRVTLAIGVAALLVMIVLLFLPGASNSDGSVVLPDREALSVDTIPGVSAENSRKISTVAVGTENVAQVVDTLSRPSEYSATNTVTYHYSEGKSTVFTVELWALEDKSKSVTSSPTLTERESILLTAQSAYFWGEDGNFFKGSKGDFTADDLSRVPTYEDIVTKSAEQILAAQIVDRQGEQCIFVQTSDPLTGYVENWYISVKTGLLLYTQSVDANQIVFESEMTAFSADAPAPDVFLLPNGANAD